MKHKFWTLLVLTAWFFAVSSITPTFAEGPKVLASPDKKHVVVITDSKPTHVSLQDLADGASKTFTSGTITITVTRKGDVLSLNIDGKDIPDSDPIFANSGQRRVMVFSNQGEPGQFVSDVQVYMFKFDGPDAKTLRVESSSEKKEVNVQNGTETTVIKLTDLADGESRTFTAGTHTLTVTRTGEKFTIKLDGRELSHAPMAMHKIPGDGKIVVMPLDGEGKDKIVNENIMVMRKVDGTDSKALEVSVMVASDKHELTVMSDGQTYKFSLEGMADGESRTFTAGTHTFTLTKSGDTYRINLDGKALPL